MIASKPVGCINIRGVTCEETTLGSGIKGFTLRPKVNDKIITYSKEAICSTSF